jgi:hypothetical protein
VLKKYENQKNTDFYRVDIEILDLYKGKKVNSIFIYGNYKRKQDSACWIFTEENEELLIYANQTNSSDEIKLYGCSRIIRLDEKKIINLETEIRVLKTLKENNINYSNNGKITFQVRPFINLVTVELHNKYENNINFDYFGIYEFSVNNNFKINKVKVLKGFDSRIDRKFKKVLKLQKWSRKQAKKLEILPKSKTFLTVYLVKRNDNLIFYTRQM